MRAILAVASAVVIVAAGCGETAVGGDGTGSGSGGPTDAGSGGGSIDGGSGSGGGSIDAGSGSTDGGTGSGDGGTDGGAGSGSGGGGVATSPVVLAGGEVTSAIAINDSNVYWVNSNGDLRTVSKNGGAISTVSHAGAVRPGFMLADEVAVYWIANGTYWRAPLGGGALAAVDSGTASFNFGSDSTTAYYQKFSGNSGAWPIVSRARDGSGAVTVHATAEHPGGGITIGPGTIYFTSWGKIFSVPADGTGATLLGAVSDDIALNAPIKYNSGQIFFRTSEGVYSIPAGGGTPSRRASAGPAGRGIEPALDANQGLAYWNDHCLESSDKGCLDTSGTNYGSVKVDDAAIYFVRDNDLLRLAK
jgi:hypothetical protein